MAAERRDCARVGCEEECEHGRWYCSEECAALAFAEKYGLTETAGWAKAAIEARAAKSTAASERMSAMQAKLTPEERSARAAKAREARTVRERGFETPESKEAARTGITGGK